MEFFSLSFLHSRLFGSQRRGLIGLALRPRGINQMTKSLKFCVVENEIVELSTYLFSLFIFSVFWLGLRLAIFKERFCLFW